MKDKLSAGKRIGIVTSIVLSVFWLFPYIYVGSSSFKPGTEVIAVPPKFFPKVFSIENFIGVFTRTDAVKYISNSLIVALVSTFIALICNTKIRNESFNMFSYSCTLLENDTDIKYCGSYI